METEEVKSRCLHGNVEAYCTLGVCGEKKVKAGLLKESCCRQSSSGYSGYRTFHRKFHVPNSPEFYKTLGYFAMYATIYAILISKTEKKFKEGYVTLKGHEPVSFCSVIDKNKWADELMVTYFLPSWELDVGNIPEVNGRGCGRCRCSNSLVWWLLEIGFDLGKRHDIEAIRSHVPEEFKEVFDSGTKEIEKRRIDGLYAS